MLHTLHCVRGTLPWTRGSDGSRVTCSRGLARERSMITSVLLLLYSDAFFALSLFCYFFIAVYSHKRGLPHAQEGTQTHLQVLM